MDYHSCAGKCTACWGRCHHTWPKDPQSRVTKSTRKLEELEEESVIWDLKGGEASLEFEHMSSGHMPDETLTSATKEEETDHADSVATQCHHTEQHKSVAQSVIHTISVNRRQRNVFTWMARGGRTAAAQGRRSRAFESVNNHDNKWTLVTIESE